jgi:hypothetical protein
VTVWIYVDTSKEVGDKDHLKVLATELAANRWFEDNDPEGVAFEYPVIRLSPRHRQLAATSRGRAVKPNQQS